jgi:putative transposase
MLFFTATINSWQKLLLDNNLKDIIIHSMTWLVENKKVQIHSFVVMPNHIHVLWTPLEEDFDVGGRFKSFTGSEIRKYLLKKHPLKLSSFISSQRDRVFHFWERRSKSIDIVTREIASQKVDYIHKNPLQERWQLVEKEEDYYYSSASFYLLDDCSKFSFLTRYEDWI